MIRAVMMVLHPNHESRQSRSGHLRNRNSATGVNLSERRYYIGKIIAHDWNGTVIPGMRGSYESGHPGLSDITKMTWRPDGNTSLAIKTQPYFKLHGSSNWKDGSGEPVLIMGSAKSGAIERFPVLKFYHEQFSALLSQSNTRLMVVGYSFQDNHINEVILNASEKHGLGTFIIDPAGRDVLKDPRMAQAVIKAPREIENIRLIGELKRTLSAIFAGDVFAHVELMRFFA